MYKHNDTNISFQVDVPKCALLINHNLASVQFAVPFIREYSKHVKPHKTEGKKYQSDSDYYSSSDSDNELLGHRVSIYVCMYTYNAAQNNINM